MHPALGIDFGEARIGVAATDPLGMLAHPVETIDVTRGDPCERIAALCRERGIRAVVIGLPLRLDGSEGEAARKVRSFARLLGARLPELPIIFVDESFTTSAAAEKLRAAGKRAKRQRPLIDQAAAVEILETWLAAQAKD